jgi:hypothetical protein
MTAARLAFAIAIVLGVPLIAACTQAPAPAVEPAKPVAVNHDQQFEALSRSWLGDWFRLNPVSATQVGSHIVDGKIEDLSEKGRKAALDFARQTLVALDAIDPATLSRENQIDYAILRNQLQQRCLERGDAAGLGLGPAGLQPARRQRHLHADGAGLRAAARAPEIGDLAHGEVAEAV